MDLEITLDEGEGHAVSVVRHETRATVTIDGRSYAGSLVATGDAYELTLGERAERIWIVVDRDTVYAHAFGRAWTLTIADPVERDAAGGPSEDVALAPMPGTVILVAVEPGRAVVRGERLVVIESMKMQSEIVALRDGVVERVFLEVGETFDRGAPLVALQREDDAEEEA